MNHNNIIERISETDLLVKKYRQLNHDYWTKSQENIIIESIHNILQYYQSNHENIDSTSDSDNKLILRLICDLIIDASISIPSIGILIVENLALLSHPKPFLDILPIIFLTSNEASIENAICELRKLAESDSNLLIPIISAISSLQIPRNRIPIFLEIVEIAISSCDEDDFPFLLRNLLKGLSYQMLSSSNYSLLRKVRTEVQALSDSVLPLVLETLLESLPTSVQLCKMFLDIIQSDSPLTVTLFDVILILTVFTEVVSMITAARHVLLYWLENECFPFEEFLKIIEHRQNNEVWEKLLPGLWRAISSIIEIVTDLSQAPINVSSSHLAYIYYSQYKSLTFLIRTFFDKIPSCQEIILKSLSHYVFPLNSFSFHKIISFPNKNSIKKEDNLVKSTVQLSHISSQSLATPNLSEPSKQAQSSKITRSLYALQVLMELVSSRGDIGNILLTSLMNKLQPDSNNRTYLPLPPVILDRLIACIVESSSYTTEIESTLLILVNKYVSTINEPNYKLMSILDFRFPRIRSKNGNSIHICSDGGCKTNSKILLNGQYEYHLRSLGYIFSSHLLRRSKDLNSQDIASICLSIQRTMSLNQDESIIFAVDTLAILVYWSISITDAAKATVRDQISKSSSEVNLYNSAVDPSTDIILCSCFKIFDNFISTYKFVRNIDTIAFFNLNTEYNLLSFGDNEEKRSDVMDNDKFDTSDRILNRDFNLENESNIYIWDIVSLSHAILNASADIGDLEMESNAPSQLILQVVWLLFNLSFLFYCKNNLHKMNEVSYICVEKKILSKKSDKIETNQTRDSFETCVVNSSSKVADGSVGGNNVSLNSFEYPFQFLYKSNCDLISKICEKSTDNIGFDRIQCILRQTWEYCLSAVVLVGKYIAVRAADCSDTCSYLPEILCQLSMTRISLLKLQVVFDHFINQNQENRSKIIKLKSKRNVAKPRRDILININSNSDIDDDIYSDNCDIASDCSADEIYNDILNADDLKENSSNCAEENVDNCIERMTQYKMLVQMHTDILNDTLKRLQHFIGYNDLATLIITVKLMNSNTALAAHYYLALKVSNALITETYVDYIKSRKVHDDCHKSRLEINCSDFYNKYRSNLTQLEMHHVKISSGISAYGDFEANSPNQFSMPTNDSNVDCEIVSRNILLISKLFGTIQPLWNRIEFIRKYSSAKEYYRNNEAESIAGTSISFNKLDHSKSETRTLCSDNSVVSNDSMRDCVTSESKLDLDGCTANLVLVCRILHHYCDGLQQQAIFSIFSNFDDADLAKGFCFKDKGEKTICSYLNRFIEIESMLNTTQDTTVAVSLFRILLSLSVSFPLKLRCGKHAWCIMRSVFTRCSFGNLNNGRILNKYDNKASEELEEIRRFASTVPDLETIFNLRQYGNVGDEITLIVSSYLGVLNDNSKQNLNVKETSEILLDIPRHRLYFFLSWLELEDADQRLFGISFLLKEYFASKLPKAINSTDLPDENKPEIKKRISAYNKAIKTEDTTPTGKSSKKRLGLLDSNVECTPRAVKLNTSHKTHSNSVNMSIIPTALPFIVAAYFALLPAILIATRPSLVVDDHGDSENINCTDFNTCSIRTDSKRTSLKAGPYDGYINTIKIFIWTLCNWQKTILYQTNHVMHCKSNKINRKNKSITSTQGYSKINAHTGQVLSLILKTCRVYISSILNSVDTCIEWRNQLPLPKHPNSDIAMDESEINNGNESEIELTTPSNGTFGFEDSSLGQSLNDKDEIINKHLDFGSVCELNRLLIWSRLSLQVIIEVLSDIKGCLQSFRIQAGNRAIQSVHNSAIKAVTQLQHVSKLHGIQQIENLNVMINQNTQNFEDKTLADYSLDNRSSVVSNSGIRNSAVDSQEENHILGIVNQLRSDIWDKDIRVRVGQFVQSNNVKLQTPPTPEMIIPQTSGLVNIQKPFLKQHQLRDLTSYDNEHNTYLKNSKKNYKEFSSSDDEANVFEAILVRSKLRKVEHSEVESRRLQDIYNNDVEVYEKKESNDDLGWGIETGDDSFY